MILHYLKSHYKISIIYLINNFFLIFFFTNITGLRSGEGFFFSWLFCLWFSHFFNIKIRVIPFIFVITFPLILIINYSAIFMIDVFAAGGTGWVQDSFLETVFSWFFTNFFLASPILANYCIEKAIYYSKFLVNKHAVLNQLF